MTIRGDNPPDLQLSHTATIEGEMDTIFEMNDDEFFAQARGQDNSQMSKSRLEDSSIVAALAERLSIKESRLSMKMRKHFIVDFNQNLNKAVSRNAEL